MRKSETVSAVVLLILAINNGECFAVRRTYHIQTTTKRALPKDRDPICERKNAYFPVDDQCDAYMECHKWKAMRQLCPDGLVFKPGTKYRTYPCVYPSDVSCEGRPRLQPPIATSDCPRLYGFFRSKNTTNCGVYQSCVDGKAFKLNCPEGLAYNIKSNQCEWPDLVEDCDVEEYLGFACPGLFGEHSSSNPINYRHPFDCKKYYACIEGKPRLLSCGEDAVFDEYSGQCEDSETSLCVVDKP